GRQAKQDAGDLAGGEVDGGEDEAVEEQAEVDGAEAADGGGGASRVAQFVELEVGEDAGSAPEACIEEDGGEAGEDEGPPDPVAGDALAADDVGDEVWGVG